MGKGRNFEEEVGKDMINVSWMRGTNERRERLTETADAHRVDGRMRFGLQFLE